MAFLFKSKKTHERSVGGSRDGTNGSQGSMQSPDSRARIVREEKGATHRATPTGSLTSLENDGSNASPDQPFNPGPLRRAPTGDPPPQGPNDMQPQVSIDDAGEVSRNSMPRFWHTAHRNRDYLANFNAIVSQRSSSPELITIPLVAAETQLHLLSSWPIPTVWRRRQRRLLERGRHVRDGRSDQ